MHRSMTLFVPRFLIAVVLAFSAAAAGAANSTQAPDETAPGEPDRWLQPRFLLHEGSCGAAAFAVRYDERTWWLTSAEQVRLFKEDPQAYAPRYAEYCPYSVALGRPLPIDPTNFTIVGGQLLLFHLTPDSDGLKGWKKSGLSVEQLHRRADARLELIVRCSRHPRFPADSHVGRQPRPGQQAVATVDQNPRRRRRRPVCPCSVSRCLPSRNHRAGCPEAVVDREASCCAQSRKV
ncbi:MAG: hypothetical protein U5R48_13765 [Gammaproteobacteria bacterium]|nr:hypothetical protein [Gammaproteobacteria bacterium]